MSERILITGGAGFIGSHLADRLIAEGRSVRALDCLVEQVHGQDAGRPAYLHPQVELMVGDVREPAVVRRALLGVDAVVHLAAAVGVGQSMTQVAHYTSVNNLGTAVLMEALAEQPVRRLVVASSMSVYGEGLYADADGSPRIVNGRSPRRLRKGRWDPVGREGERLIPVSTPEEKPAAPASVYALSKWDQERLCLMLGETHAIPAVALRFFNAYGPRQALSNPYTGVLAIFGARLLAGQPPQLFEDGRQRRDFVDVRDVAQGCALALDRDEAVGHALNVGSGKPYSILEVARRMAEMLDRPALEPEILGRYRPGDIRHCFADLTQARRLLGYEPEHDLNDGMRTLGAWLQSQSADARSPAPARRVSS